VNEVVNYSKVLKITWKYVCTLTYIKFALLATWIFPVQHLFYMYLLRSENVAVCQQLQATIKLHGLTNAEFYQDTYCLDVVSGVRVPESTSEN